MIRTLHPVYIVSVATFLFCGWTVTLFFAISSDALWVGEDGTEGSGYYTALPGLLIVQDMCYGVVALS